MDNTSTCVIRSRGRKISDSTVEDDRNEKQKSGNEEEYIEDYYYSPTEEEDIEEEVFKIKWKNSVVKKKR